MNGRKHVTAASSRARMRSGTNLPLLGLSWKTLKTECGGRRSEFLWLQVFGTGPIAIGRGSDTQRRNSKFQITNSKVQGPKVESPKSKGQVHRSKHLLKSCPL